MTQEEKQLLLKDLCERLPYGVKIAKDNVIYPLTALGYVELAISERISIEEVRPYLRPISSMTEEEKNELRNLLWFGYPSDDYDNYSHRGIEIKTCLYDDEEKSEYDFEDFELLKDFLLKNHLDYHGLIPMGLALPATEEIYKTK